MNQSLKSTKNSKMIFYVEWMDAMTDLVRILSPNNEVLFENAAMKKFSKQMGKDGQALLPDLRDSTVLSDGKSQQTEFCVQKKVYSLSTSPFYEDDELVGVIQIFRDTTLQNELTISLDKNRKRLENDLHLAQNIQSAMLPQLTEYGPLHFDYRYLPTEELSGDFFDIIPISKGKVALYIADVVGHGISASILTMFVRQTMRSILLEKKIISPSRVLSTVLNKYKEIQLSEQQYFTLFYALFDYEKKTVTYANAGHNCLPMMKYHNHVKELESKGMMISPLFSDFNYKDTSLSYKPGTEILFYTDGTVESLSPNDEPFGNERLKKSFQKGGKGFLDRLLEELDQFRQGRQEDDISLLLVRCN